MYLLVIKQLLIMMFIAAAGFAVSKAFKFGVTEQQFVSRMLLYFINPCLIVTSFDVPFSVLRLKQLGTAALAALAVHIVLTVLAEIFSRSKNEKERPLDSLDKIAVVFTNCAFIGIPLIKGVFGEGGVFYLMGYLIVFNVYLWTYGYRAVCGKFNFRKIALNPNVLAVVSGVLLFCLPVRLPELIAGPVGLIGGLNTALSMILLGMLFANFRKPDGNCIGIYVRRIAKLSFVRLVAAAVIDFFIVFAFYKMFSGLHDIRRLCYVVYISSLCPVGMSVSSFAVIFHKDESYSSLQVSATSALCVFTIPAAVALAELFF